MHILLMLWSPSTPACPYLLRSGVGESTPVHCGFKSISDFIELGEKLGLGNVNATISQLGEIGWPTTSIEASCVITLCQLLGRPTIRLSY